MSNLRPCPDCGKEVSKAAKTCPNCGRSLAAKQFGCGTTIVVVLGALWVIGALLPDGTSTPPSAPVTVVDRSASKQAERKKVIAKSISAGLILKIREGRVPKVYVSRLFDAMTYDEKSNFAGMLYAYYHDGSSALQRVEFFDGMNGKKIGYFPTMSGALDLED
jgi:hypothetical protein